MGRAVLIIGIVGLLLALGALPLDLHASAALVVDVMAIVASAALSAVALWLVRREHRQRETRAHPED